MADDMQMSEPVTSAQSHTGASHDTDNSDLLDFVSSPTGLPVPTMTPADAISPRPAANLQAHASASEAEFAHGIENEFQAARNDAWEYAALFDSLATCMHHDRYEWSVLLPLAAVLLGEKDSVAGGTGSSPPRSSGATIRRQRRQIAAPEDEEEDEETDAFDMSFDGGDATETTTTSGSASTDAINPSDLGSHQSRAFRYLHVCIIRHLNSGFDPIPTPSLATAPNVSRGPSSSSTASPIVSPKSGDVIGVWLVSLLCAAKNRSVALSLLKSIEVAGRVSSLRVTLQKLFLLLQRDRTPDDSPAFGVEDHSVSDSFVSPHLAATYVTPSSMMPLHAISSQALHRLRLHASLLRTLQVLISDGVTLPSVTTLLGGSSDTSNRPKPSGPNIFYEFADTPIFPRISGGVAPSANGYCWSCWINVSALATPPAATGSPTGSATSSPIPTSTHAHNVYKFFNDVGHGVQVYLKSNTLCVRVLPNMTDSYPLKNFLLHEHRWYHVVIVHKPKVSIKPTTGAPPTVPLTSNMANVTSFAAARALSPNAAGASSPAQPATASPTSPSVPPRAAQMFLYIDGLLVSSNDVPYPSIDHSEGMQVSLGGYTGKMGAFHHYHDLLAPASIYSLFTLGSGLFSAPAHHIVNTGLVAVFPPPPSATSLNLDGANSAASVRDDHGQHVPHSATPALVTHRIVSRVLISHSPAQTTHEFCLPYAWSDDWHLDQAKVPNACASHTMRLPGVDVHRRRNNSQSFGDVGGLKLLMQSLSPMYAGAATSAHLTDEFVSEMLTLLALAVHAHPLNANQLLEVGAATMKQLLLEHLRKKHKTAVMINGLKNFLLVVAAIDHTSEQVHFASFVSYLLLDLTYWRACSMHVQSLVVHLLKLLVLHNPRPFSVHPTIGVSRIVDSIRVVTHRFFAPETQAAQAQGQTSTAPTPSTLSPEPAAVENAHSRHESVNLQINIDTVSPSLMSAYSPTANTPSPLVVSPVAASAEPTEGELHLVRSFLSISVTIAQQSVGSPNFESHVLQPLLHLLQLSTVSASNFPADLLSEFLHAFLVLIPLSSHRALSYLHSQNAVHIFVRLLFVDSAAVRTLSLRCLQYLNHHLVRLNKLDRGKSDATTENIYLQSDIAAAIGSCLSLHTPISAQEHDALFEILMGQMPQPIDGGVTAAAPADTPATSSSPQAMRHKMHRGMSLETGLQFCHSAYLSVILDLTLSSPLEIQSKVLLDLLTLLRSNPHNVLVMASLFWQRMLLPFLSTIASGTHINVDGSSSDRDTIDVLVYQLLNLLLVHSMTNEPKGWQVLDQVVWCLDEKDRVRMLAAISQPTPTTDGAVSDQWRVQVAVFNRLFQSLQKSVIYLALPATTAKSSSGTASSADSVTSSHGAFALHSDQQVANLRRNVPAVFELTEWLLFHSKDSFLSIASRTRAGSATDQPESSGEQAGSGSRKNSFLSELHPSAPPADDAASASALDANVQSVNADMPPPTNPMYRPPSISSRSSMSAVIVSRASLRGVDEPLTEVEIELLAGLLTGVVKSYPLPERRQDVLRIMFRYLMVVLPHPLCASLCPLICDCVLHLFTERIIEVSDKNNRLIALSLHLLKQSMELFLRREDDAAVVQVKTVMGAVFARYGPQVFQTLDPANTVPAKLNATPVLLPRALSTQATPAPEIDLLTGDIVQPAALTIAATDVDADADASASVPHHETPLEQALFHLYSGVGRSVVDATQQVFEQHELRLGYVCDARARQVADAISAYIKKQQLVEGRREKTFSLQSMDVQKRVQRERPFLLGLYQMKKGKVAFRRRPKDVKHAIKIHKLLKHYHYQHANSRPRPMLPALLPQSILSLLHPSSDAFSPFLRASDLPAAKINYSSQLEFWKLDSTESPTRMRRLVKKNFRGSSHAAASQNAATGRTAVMAPQALDLANSLKNAGIKNDGTSHSTADADTVLHEAPTPTSTHATPLLAHGHFESHEDDEDDAHDSGDDDDVMDLDQDEEERSDTPKRSNYLLTRECVMITTERRYLGTIKIAQQHIVFSGTEMIKVEPPQGGVAPADAPKPRKPKEKFLRWPLKHIRMVLPRLYLLRESALEVFLNNFKNHFFNFTPVDLETSDISWASDAASNSSSNSKAAAAAKQPVNKKLRSGREQRNEVYKLICSLCPEMQVELSPARRLAKSGIMKKWQRGEISNFDYLMHLNTCLLSSTPVAVADGRTLRADEITSDMLLVNPSGAPVAVKSVQPTKFSPVMIRIKTEHGQHVVTPNHLVTMRWSCNPVVLRDDASVTVEWRDRRSLEVRQQRWLCASSVSDAFNTLPARIRPYAHEFARWWIRRQESAGVEFPLCRGDLFDVRADRLMHRLSKDAAFMAHATVPMARLARERVVSLNEESSLAAALAAATIDWPESDDCAQTQEELICSVPTDDTSVHAVSNCDDARISDRLADLFFAEVMPLVLADAAVSDLKPIVSHPSGRVATWATKEQVQQAIATATETMRVAVESAVPHQQHTLRPSKLADGSYQYEPIRSHDDVAVAYLLRNQTNTKGAHDSLQQKAYSFLQLERAWDLLDINPTTEKMIVADTPDLTSGVEAMLAANSLPAIIIAIGDDDQARLRSLPGVIDVSPVMEEFANGVRSCTVSTVSGTTKIVFAPHPTAGWHFSDLLATLSSAHGLSLARSLLDDLATGTASPLICVDVAPGGLYTAIELDSEDRRFVLGDFTITHNCSGRSYNDINQYPVFPWVLSDYKSQTLDLDDPSVYRDLSKPIGALNEDRLEIYNERYHTFDDPDIPAFMYGSHYSSAGIALYYLLRLEPFTHLAVALQGNHFDLPDRLFDSMSGAWDLSLSNLADVKELTPEFFYLPDFLRNLNGLDLGTKQDKQKLGDVVLPPWAKGSPEEFVRIHRAALESEYVSAHLHEWIDLIWGYKQKGKAAVDASNVFFYLTYAGAVDIDAIDNPALRKATEDQIAHFGQTPSQLMTTPHPARFSAAERSKIAAAAIALPATLMSTYSSQLIHYYQPSREKAAAAARRQAAIKARMQQSKTMQPRGSVSSPPVAAESQPAPLPEPTPSHTFESDRASILSQVPTSLCFAARDVVIGVTSDFALQTHNLASFIVQPPQVLPPGPEDLATDDTANTPPERVVDAEASEAAPSTVASGSQDNNEEEDSNSLEESVSSDGSSSLPHSTSAVSSASNLLSDPDLLAPQPAPSATAAISAAGQLLVSTLASTPSLFRKHIASMTPAQSVPPSVQASHVIHPMCKHWFLEPSDKPNEKDTVSLQNAPAAASAVIAPPAQPSTRPRPSSLSAPIGPTRPCVTTVAHNGQFLFSGGYFDGSLKCHSIVQLKVDEPASHTAPEITSPRHARSPTSPSVMTATAVAAITAAAASRTPITTRRTVDCKPLSTVQAHHAPITALCLAQNQSILFSGDALGSLCVWRVFTEKHERNRPPLSSAPLATFAVHEGRILSIASNTYIGVAVSLATDMQGQRGCEICVYSVRGGNARFIRSQLATDPSIEWQQVVITSSGTIVLSGSQAGVPMLFAYSINGQLICTRPTEEVINVLYATPPTPKTNAYEGFVVTGGRKSVVVFRSPHTLEPVQSFFCDDLFPQSIAHNLPQPATDAKSTADAVASTVIPPPAPVVDLWDGTSSSDANEPNSSSEDTPTKVASDAATSAVPAPVPSSAVTRDDPLVSSLVCDLSVPIRMGVAAFDISPSQRHFVVAVYPHPCPPTPTASEDVDAAVHHLDGRLLLFPLPHSSQDSSQLGFYLTYGMHTLSTVRDALSHRMSESRDKFNEARERLATTAGKANEKFQAAKTKFFSSFSGLWGKQK